MPKRPAQSRRPILWDSKSDRVCNGLDHVISSLAHLEWVLSSRRGGKRGMKTTENFPFEVEETPNLWIWLARWSTTGRPHVASGN